MHSACAHPWRRSAALTRGLTRTRTGGPKAISHGFTLVELLVVIVIIGVLFSILLPALHLTRETARRAGCLNNLRQMGIGLKGYHNINRSYPRGCTEPRRRNEGRQLAWSAYLLPYIDQQPLFDQIDFEKPFCAPENEKAAAVIVPVYICPSAPEGSELREGWTCPSAPEEIKRRTGRGPCQYGGIYGERIKGRNDPPTGVMLYDRAVKEAEIRDGTSQTLVISEDSQYDDGQWINGRNIFDQAYLINQAPDFENDIRSEHPGGANGLFCDGSARFLSETMDEDTLAAICTRAGGENVGDYFQGGR
jgi:prepilin-type N-terminal cleavage/methylation domain-containing protein/prepilin-type processing-associated H-X9-DG protein